MQNTWMAKKEEITDEDRDWYLIDAKNKSLGRLASEIATLLQGKHKPIYTPHVDTGDFVVVLNSTEVRLTGNKAEQKKHYTHSGYLGNLNSKSYGELLEEGSLVPVQEAVRRMMPKNKLGKKMMKKLKLYPSTEHPHNDQDLIEYEID